MKKLFAILLAVVTVLSLSATALAATGGSITVTNAKPGETYHLYKMLDLSLDHEKGAYTYTLPQDSKWEPFIKGDGATWFAFNETSRIVTAKSTLTDSSVGLLASAALLFAQDPKNEVPSQAATATTATVTFNNLDLGYYLIDTTVGSAVILETNNVNVTVADKSAGPRIEKKVEEDSKPGQWGDKSTAAILQTVNYKVEISNVQKLYKLDMRDTMSKGLTFDPNSVKVYKNSISDANLILGETVNEETGKYETIGHEGTWYLVDATHESPDFGQEHLGSNTFHIHFRNYFINQMSVDDKIIVTYSATLNKDAVIGGDAENFTGGNPNEVYLAWGNSQESTHDIVRTYTWELPIYKYTKTADNDSQPLAGAKFIVAKDRGAKGHGYVKAVDENGKITEWTYDRRQAYVFVTDSTGLFKVSGLDADKHFVEEVEAPAGYNKLTHPISIVISEEGVIRNSESHVITQLEIENKTGTELPSTGGVGTTIFVTVGLMGVLVMGVFLVTNKRMKKEGF